MDVDDSAKSVALSEAVNPACAMNPPPTKLPRTGAASEARRFFTGSVMFSDTSDLAESTTGEHPRPPPPKPRPASATRSAVTSPTGPPEPAGPPPSVAATSGHFGLDEPELRVLPPPKPAPMGGVPIIKGKGRGKGRGKGKDKGKGKDGGDGRRAQTRPDLSRTPGPTGS